MSMMWAVFVPPLVVISALFYGALGLVIFSAYESYHYRRKQKARR